MSIPPTQIEVRGELLQRFGYYPAGFKKPSPEKLAELHIEPEEAERKFKKINEKVIEVAKVYPEFMKSFGVPLIAILVIGIGLICFAIGFFLTIPTSVSAKPSKWDPQTQFQYDALVLLSEVLFILPITYLLVMFISTKQTISRANMELIYGVNFVLQKYLPESRSTGIYWSLEVRNIKRFYIFSRNQKVPAI